MTTTEPEMHDFLYAGTTRDIAALIAACDFPQHAFLLAEQIPREAVTVSQRQELLQCMFVSELQRRDAPAPGDPGIDPARYTSGRVFCRQCELRWQTSQRTGEIQVVYLGEQERALPDLVPAPDLATLRAELHTLQKQHKPARYYLFGTTLDTSAEGQQLLQQLDPANASQRYYAEVRIPRLLRYPRLADAGEKRRVQVIVCQYTEKETGNVRLFRFQDIQPAE
jgi:hypothetical protein